MSTRKKILVSLFLTSLAIAYRSDLWLSNNSFVISILIISLLLLFFVVFSNASGIIDIIKKNPKNDLIFLIIFLFLLFIPTSHINLDEISANENRELNKYKPLYSKKSGINCNYPNDLSEWLNDRFAYRGNLISLYTFLNCSINRYSCEFNGARLYKKYNYIYIDSSRGLSKIKSKEKQNILKTYAYNVNKLEEYCKKNNIKLYIMIVPRRFDYFDYKIFKKINPDITDDVMAYLMKHTKTNIIYPKKAMSAANEYTPVYFKTDHHWTKKGAYAGYYELLHSYIVKDFPDVPILNENSLDIFYDRRVKSSFKEDFEIGETLEKLHLPKFYQNKILDKYYLYYINPNKENLHIVNNLLPDTDIDIENEKIYEFYYPYGADKKVMLIGNSFIYNFLDFLPYSFKYTIGLYDNKRKMHMSEYNDYIKMYKPDVLILMFHSYNTSRLLNLYENKYNNDK